MVGTKAPKKISVASGTTSGTPISHSPTPAVTASTAATTTVARTYPTSEAKARRPATSARRRAVRGTAPRTNAQIRDPSCTRKISTNSISRVSAASSPAVPSAPRTLFASAAWLRCRVSSTDWKVAASRASSRWNGAAASRSRRATTLSPIRADRSGSPVRNAATAHQSTAIAIARPPATTTPVATARGTYGTPASSRATGASSAARISASTAGTTSTASCASTHPTTASAAAISRTRHAMPEAVRRPPGMRGSSGCCVTRRR
ncbi:hypothetical protein AFB00_08375 [Pseudonocardia sp. HH130630-07]|nr:hypothetical protein [Pseudonocardia sp. HH130630-07]ANY06307.1 hypothetical protein AFB00_08375 [Pseudonocardia sp. HH130630-07]